MDELTFHPKRYHPPQHFQFNRRYLSESGVVGQIVIPIFNCKAPGEKCYRERGGPRRCIFQINKEAEGPVISPDTPGIGSAGVCRRQDRVAATRGHWLSPSTTLLSKLLIDSTVLARLLLRLLFNPISAVCTPGHRRADVPLIIWLRIILIRSPANLALVHSWLIWFIQILQIFALWYLAT